MAFHSKYWNCSKFADLIRGTNKPYAATSKEWNEWDKMAKEAHPFRFWIVENLFSAIQDIITYPYRKLNDIKCAISNRLNKRYALSSNLNKWQWHDLDTRILHCCFDELVRFVEEEKANRWRWSHTIPTTGREAGLAYLDWEISLVHDYVPENHELYGKPTPQAEDAQWVKDAYIWWTETRPSRPDVHEVCGWNSYCDNHPCTLYFEDRSPEEQEHVRDLLDKMRVLEQEYLDEDNDFLIQLIKHRTSYWT